MKTTIHRKGAMVVTDYQYLYSFALQSDDCPTGVNLQQLWADRKEAHYHRSGGCAACGQTNYLYGAMVTHLPTGQLVELGWQCAETLDFGHAFANEQSQVLAEVSRLKKEHEAQQRIARANEWIAATPWAAEVFDWCAGNATVQDLLLSLRRWGNLTDPQQALLQKIHSAEHDRRNGAPRVQAPQGTGLTVTGKLLARRVEETVYGSTTKMLLDVPADGGSWRAWGTLPKCHWHAKVGDTITFRCDVLRSHKDNSFGLVKRARPTPKG